MKVVGALLGAGLLFAVGAPAAYAEEPGVDVPGIARRMEATFRHLEAYTCEVDHRYLGGGRQEERYRFRYAFRKEKQVRLDFIEPYGTVALVYRAPEERVTVLPFRSLPALKLRFRLDSPRVVSPAGQRLDQTDLGYFLEFLGRNLARVAQGSPDLRTADGLATFRLQGLDYLRDREPETYRIAVSTASWLPVRIERYSRAGELLELSHISGYDLSPNLPEDFFSP